MPPPALSLHLDPPCLRRFLRIGTFGRFVGAVLLWVRDNRDGFSDRYAHAREIQLDGIADEMLDLVDDSRNDWIERESKSGDVQIVFDREHVDRTRLRVDTRKWLLTNLKPQKFGDKIEQTHKGDSGHR